MNEILEDLDFEEILVKLVNKTPKRLRVGLVSKTNTLRRLKSTTGLKQTIVMDIFKVLVDTGALVLMEEHEVEGRNGSFMTRYYAVDLIAVSKMATRTGVKAKVGGLVGPDYQRPRA